MSLRHLLLLVGYGYIACAVGVLSATPGKPIYTLSKSVPLGAPDRWDLLAFDESSHRVYVAHGDKVTVIDGESGALVGQVGFPAVRMASRSFLKWVAAGYATMGCRNSDILRPQDAHTG